MDITGKVDVVVFAPTLSGDGQQEYAVDLPQPQTQKGADAMANTDLYEVAVDSWGSSPPIYTRGLIVSADALTKAGRDMEWAVRSGILKILEDDDPRIKDGPSPEPSTMPFVGSDGWDHPMFPYRAPVSRAESEAAAASERATNAGAVSADVASAAAAAAATAKATADAAASAKARSTAAAKQAAAAAKLAEKEGVDRTPSSADIAVGAAPVVDGSQAGAADGTEGQQSDESPAPISGST